MFALCLEWLDLFFEGRMASICHLEPEKKCILKDIGIKGQSEMCVEIYGRFQCFTVNVC